MKIMNYPIIRLVDRMGTDESVVNAARVSFNKVVNDLSDKDIKLLNYLARNGHWSPFAHTSISIRCKAPIFLARQLVKHQVGGSWNEVSRRYVSEEPTIYVPDIVHTSPENAKQGCGEAHPSTGDYVSEIRKVSEALVDEYNKLIDADIAPEEARMILPLNMCTEWIWTGSLYFFYRVYKQRSDSHAQLIAQDFARELDKLMSFLYPNAWKALKDNV